MGIDVNAKTGCGYTALLYSTRHYEILELLISYGADVNHARDGGYTALMDAFQSGQPIPTGAGSCVRLLLENGANPNAVCNFGWNALLFALKFKYQNVSDVKLLLEYNIDLEGLYTSSSSSSSSSSSEDEDDDDDVSKPLLYFAFAFVNFEVAELLVEYGIDMTKQDWLLDTEHLPNGLRGNDYLYNKLLDLYRNPASLKVLVRNNLRRLLGRSIRVAPTQLGLPKALENFVTYK